MTEARRKTLKVKDMQRRVIGKAMNAAKYGLQMRESAKTISMRTEDKHVARVEQYAEAAACEAIQVAAMARKYLDMLERMDE